MRRALILTAAFAALATPALAQTQSQQPAGGRYLGWAGRTTDTAARGPQSASSEGLRRPAAVIPHAGVGAPPVTLASANVSVPRTPDRIQRSGLTPATAWLSPETDAPAPAAAQPEYLPERPAPVQPTPQPVRAAPQPVPPTPAPTRPTPPVEQPRIEQPAPAPVRTLPEGPEFDPADPMAPRRDAPIFRMQQPAPPAAQPENPRAQTQQPQPQRQAPIQTASVNTGQPTQTARYYSVHRPTGRQPDPVALPDQVTLDELQLTDAPTSADLAEPQAGPTLMRNAEGRLVPVPGQDMDPQ